MLKLSPPCLRLVASQTPGISRNLTVYESEDGGGDLNGTAAHHLKGHAGTAGTRFAVPRGLQYQTTGGNTLPDYVTEAPATGDIYARQGSTQSWQLLAGATASVPVVGPGWIVNQWLNYRLLSGGATIEVSGILQRASGQGIPPGAAGNIILCTLPIRPVANSQLQVCACLADTGIGSNPEDLIEYGYLLFTSAGSLAFYGHATDRGTNGGTTTIYVSNIFGVTMPGTATDVLPEMMLRPAAQPAPRRSRHNLWGLLS